MGTTVLVFVLTANLLSGIKAANTENETPTTQTPIDHILRFNYPFDVFLTPKFYYSCEEAWEAGFKNRGIYSIALNNVPESNSLEQRWTWIVCNNTEERASTVVLYREPGTENFTRTFDEYVNGFGSAKTDYFLGLENIRNLTKNGHNVLTITIQDPWGNVHSIRYEFFMMKGAPDYEFDTNGIGQGDLPDDFYFHRNLPFRAPGKPDRREDGLSCAEKLQVSVLIQ
uniref:Fibrinogen C-terminal domain-containing protein n=1 Tax=Plectus sambesii TaxID=2011161 RepID=A0A914URX1_9BILA